MQRYKECVFNPLYALENLLHLASSAKTKVTLHF